MRININGQSKEFIDGENLHTVIQQCLQRTERVIAELNGAIVKQAQWSEKKLKDGDTLELVSFVGGG